MAAVAADILTNWTATRVVWPGHVALVPLGSHHAYSDARIATVE